MSDGRPGLPAEIERPETLLVNGLGPLFRAERAGRAVLVQLLPGIAAREIPEPERRRLAAPPHAALLPVTLDEGPSGAVAVAPLDGTLLSLARASDRLTARRAAGAGLSLVSAALALEAEGGALGPLTPANVLLDADADLPLRVFPIGPFFPGPAGVAAHSPEDLLLVDRDTLRGSPGPGSAAFSIGAVLLLAACGREALPAAPPTARELVRAIVLGGHPLARAAIPEGPLASAFAAALRWPGGGGSSLALLGEALRRVTEEADPLARALALAGRGEGLAALAVLHRTPDAARSLAAHLLRARIEESLGHRERAARTLRAVRSTFPGCVEAAESLGRLSADEAEAAACRDEAARLGASPGQRRARAAEAIVSGRLDAGIEGLERVRVEAAIDPSLAREGLAATIALARPLSGAGRHAALLELLAAPRWEVDDLDDADLAAERDEARGHAHFALGAWEESATAFRAAVAHNAQFRGAPRPALLADLAHALVAAGQREEARAAVLRSLELDPSQERMQRLRAALERSEGGS